MTEYVEIDGTNLFETDDAVKFDTGDEEVWIPKSVMGEWPELEETDEILVAKWFAEKEGLI